MTVYISFIILLFQMDLVDENASPDCALQCIKWCINHGDLTALREHLRHHYSKVKHDLIPLLFHAFSKQKVDVIKLLLASLDDDVLSHTGVNRRALLNKLICFAVEIDDTEIVNDLIDKGADVNCNYHGKPLLHVAACYGNTGVVTLLVNAGCDIHSRDKSGDGIIHSIITSQSALKVNNCYTRKLV